MKTSAKILIVAVLGAAIAGVMVAKTSKPAAPAASQPIVKNLPRMVDLGANKCIPCKMMAPILEELKKEYSGKLEVEFIDVWQNPDAAKQFGVEAIPTQIFYDPNGKELFRHQGFFAKEEILAKWKELGVTLDKTSAQ